MGGGLAGKGVDEENMSLICTGIWDVVGLVGPGRCWGRGVCALSAIESLSRNGDDKAGLGTEGGGVVIREGGLFAVTGDGRVAVLRR
jgi:hypothetical protein